MVLLLSNCRDTSLRAGPARDGQDKHYYGAGVSLPQPQGKQGSNSAQQGAQSAELCRHLLAANPGVRAVQCSCG